MTFTHAIARQPAANAGEGLTSAGRGAPDPERMLAQHRDYVRILESLGLQITVLDGDENFPDGCFVEDSAVVTREVAIITRSGAPSRRGEEAAIEPLLAAHRPIARIAAPGTVDGGDVLMMGERVLIGLSARTNEEGARQLTDILEAGGMRCITLAAGGGLHLKSSVNGLGDDRLLVGDLDQVFLPDNLSGRLSGPRHLLEDGLGNLAADGAVLRELDQSGQIRGFDFKFRNGSLPLF